MTEDHPAPIHAESSKSPPSPQRLMPFLKILIAAALVVSAITTTTCRSPKKTHHQRIGTLTQRTGDEIMIAGRYVHTDAPVVLWTDPGGYDAYRVERRFSPNDKSAWKSIQNAIPSPNRFGLRDDELDPETLERVRGGGWTLQDLQRTIDQFVLHYDVCGTSQQCFKVLHDRRGLSVHFLLDIDGTIYQTLDVKERAWHATKANNRSIGIEIAHIGAYPKIEDSPLETWYQQDKQGYRIVLPDWMSTGGVRTNGFTGRPATTQFLTGEINGNPLIQPDFTPEQYQSLIKLTAALCRVLPLIECDYPRDAQGKPLNRALTNAEFDSYRGVLGHQHIQENKVDPGPAMDWSKVINGAREILDKDG